jgi:hypothetical protein
MSIDFEVKPNLSFEAKAPMPFIFKLVFIKLVASIIATEAR